MGKREGGLEIKGPSVHVWMTGGATYDAWKALFKKIDEAVVVSENLAEIEALFDDFLYKYTLDIDAIDRSLEYERGYIDGESDAEERDTPLRYEAGGI